MPFAHGVNNQVKGAPLVKTRVARISQPLSQDQTLGTVDDATIYSNISGDVNYPVANSLSDTLDYIVTNAQGSLLIRSTSGWIALAPGTSGYLLQTQGAAADPIWSLQTRATSFTSGVSPTAPNNTSFTMAGLNAAITPVVTGNALITISGTIVDASNLVAGVGISYQIRTGTGSAPTANSFVKGTLRGGPQTYTAPVAPAAAANVNIPFSISAVATGLTLNAANWVDLSHKAIVTVSQYSMVNVQISIVEI